MSSMYRQYQNPLDLEASLRRAKEALTAALDKNEDMDRIVSLHDDVEDLEARVRFAWDDQEYDECY